MSRLFFSSLVFIALFAGLFNTGVDAQPSDSQRDELNRYRALGQAYMEDDDFPNAIVSFQKAVELAPGSAADLINLGMANYHGGNNDESIRLLNQGLKIDPENLFAFYTLGLAYKKVGDSENASRYFQEVANRDDTDAATTYNLGLALSKIKRDDEAEKWFKRTLELDPKHSSAVYRLLLHARINLKDMALAQKYNDLFRELKKDEAQRPADAVDEGKFLGPIEFPIALKDRPKFTSELSVTYAPYPARTIAMTEALGFANGTFLAAVPDIEKHQTAVVVSCATNTQVLLVSEKGKVEQRSTVPGGPWLKCKPVDYDNNKTTDLLLINKSQTYLFHNDGSWTFKLINASLDMNIGGVSDACWADFDHEGDLDLFLARPEEGDLLYQNNADGTFTNITGTVQGLDTGKSLSLIASDLDNDNDLDIVRLAGNSQIEIFANNRNVSFTKTVSHKLERPANGQPTLICKDFDNDGIMEITCTGLDANGPLAWKENDGQLVPMDLSGTDKGICLFDVLDVNNDGFEDFLFETHPFHSSRPHAALYLNQLPLLDFKLDTQPFSGLGLESPVATDIDFDGDLDLLASIKYKDSKYVSELVVLENQGGNQNKSLTLKIIGAKNSVDGYGSKILVKDGLYRVKKEVTSPVTHIGLGPRENVDVLRVTWPNGVFQNAIKAATAQILCVTEKPGYAGSCPFIYAWNGERYEFIADSLCTGPLGLYVGGGYFPFDPDEYVRVRSEQIKPKDGYYEMMVREELREIIYLEQLELLSASHPDAKEIFVNERFTTPPFPEFKLIGRSDKARPVRRVIDSRGNDVTGLVAENDNRYPRPFSPSRYDGVGEEHWFEIDPGEIDGSDKVYLYMTGYVDWPNSSNARSLEQNPSLDFVMPYLQVKNEAGEWVTVRNPMGFPAGKLKTVPLDISDIFLCNDHTMRIVSTVQVHWDRFMIDTAPILDGFDVQHHPYESSELRYGGYSDRYDLAGNGPYWYDYNHRTTNARWDYHLGFFTRFGDVTPLLTDFDDRYVIMTHGDEVKAKFKATPINGTANALTFFVHITGWVKDLDCSTLTSQTVLPLPFKGMSDYPYPGNESYPLTDENLLYMADYNTRQYTQPNETLTRPHPIEAAEGVRRFHPTSE